VLFREKLPEVVFQQNVENFIEGESYSSEEEASILTPEPEHEAQADEPVAPADPNAAAAAAPQPDQAAPDQRPKKKGKKQRTIQCAHFCPFTCLANCHTLAEPEPIKKKMRTSWDVYNRLKWDPALREHTWIVGHEDRFDGVLEATLEEFTQAEIPWHRVRYFKKNGEIVWDRRNRIDKIFVAE